MILRDGVYRGRVIGRPHPASGDPLQHREPHTDPFLSFFCQYVLRGHTGGVAVFDDLFGEMKSICLEPGDRFECLIADPFVATLLSLVINVYNMRHPATPVLFPEEPSTSQQEHVS